MKNKIKIIGICGKAGAGKDTLLRKLTQQYQVHPIVSCTTRPKREGEREGIDYFFMTKEEFTKKLVSDEILEATEFNGWFYGTPKIGVSETDWNVGVFNPEGVTYLIDNPNIEEHIFYIDVPAKIRIKRQLNREENPDVDEIIRRYTTDKRDFMPLDRGFVNATCLTNTKREDLDIMAKIVASKCGFLGKTN